LAKFQGTIAGNSRQCSSRLRRKRTVVGYLEIKNRSLSSVRLAAGPGRNATAGGVKLPDDVRNPKTRRAGVGRFTVERRWVGAGPKGLAGKRIEFPDCN
jgi:hypothetical protein